MLNHLTKTRMSFSGENYMKTLDKIVIIGTLPIRRGKKRIFFTILETLAFEN